MNNKPFFSIVLPTLNRAKYLSFAIQSVLNQSFEDFELIVSDNSSTDNTEEVVEQFSDTRIRYVKTAKKLPMNESWEFALSYAKGEYITFIGDDDAYSRIYLESFKSIIEEHKVDVVACKMADYYYQGVAEHGNNVKPDSLVTTSFTNKLFIYDASEAIKNLFVSLGLCKGNVSEQIQIPQAINAAYHNSVFAKIKNKLGKVFPSILSGDYYLAVIVFSFIKNYYYLDAPLSFHGISNVSTTSSISIREKELSLKETQPELAVFKKVPFKFFVPYNFSVDAVLLAKSHLGEKLGYLDLDLTGYFIEMYQHLHASELNGNDISAESEAFSAAIREQDSQLQNQLQSLIFSKKNLLKNKFRLKFYENGLYRFLSRLRSPDKRVIIEGKSNDFNNIVECASFVESNFLKTYAIKETGI